MILVTGATGNIGRELVRELDTRGARFRILVRDPARAAELPGSAGRVVGDLDEPDTLTAAFEGVDKLFLLVPGIGLDHTVHAVAAAQAAGVSHIVLVSSFNVLGDPMPAMGRWHHDREQIVQGSGIPTTVLRPGGFMTNALEWGPAIREGGHVLDPTGPGRYAPIDPADVAAVAALVLTSDGHAGRAYALTGAETFTIREQVGVLAAALGREVEVREVSTAAEVIRARYPRGVPEALADALIEAAESMRAETVGFRTDTVELLLGRKPRTFADWCARNADAFRAPAPIGPG